MKATSGQLAGAYAKAKAVGNNGGEGLKLGLHRSAELPRGTEAHLLGRSADG